MLQLLADVTPRALVVQAPVLRAMAHLAIILGNIAIVCGVGYYAIRIFGRMIFP